MARKEYLRCLVIDLPIAFPEQLSHMNEKIKTNTLMKRVASELRRNRIITDVAEESILHSPIFNSAKLFRRSKLEGETTEQFNKRVPFSRAKYGLILTAMRHGIQQ